MTLAQRRNLPLRFVFLREIRYMYLVTNRLLGMKYLSHLKGAPQHPKTLGYPLGCLHLNPLFVGIPGGEGEGVPLRGTDRPESAAETMVEQITRVVSNQLSKTIAGNVPPC